MKIKIIKSMSFDEYNERLYYEPLQDEKLELTRRDFIKYLTVGSAGLLVPTFHSKESEANIVAVAYAIFYAGVMAAGYIFGEEKYNNVSYPKYSTPEKPIIVNITLKNDNLQRANDGLTCKIYDVKKERFVFEGSEKAFSVEPKTIVKTNIETGYICQSGPHVAKVANDISKKNAKFFV